MSYPGILDRIKAILIDGFVLIVLILIVGFVFSQFQSVPDNARIIAFVSIFFLYDPFFTSILGGTIGHHVVGIRVKRELNEEKNILFPFAIMRFIVKASLGWISLLTVSGSEKRQAIHDVVAGSVVVYERYKDTTDSKAFEDESILDDE